MSVLLSSLGSAVGAGAAGYICCRFSNQQPAFEKAVLVTFVVALRWVAQAAVDHPSIRLRGKELIKHCTFLLAIPCALYAGRLCKFKTHDYLQIAGLASIGTVITVACTKLYKMLQ